MPSPKQALAGMPESKPAKLSVKEFLSALLDNTFGSGADARRQRNFDETVRLAAEGDPEAEMRIIRDQQGEPTQVLPKFEPAIMGSLFHGTSSMRLPGILRRGIRPRREVAIDVPQLARQGKRQAAFLTDDVFTAAEFAEQKAAGDIRAALFRRNSPLFSGEAEGMTRGQMAASPELSGRIGVARGELGKSIKPTILEFSDDLRNVGIPDEMFPGEKAFLFPKGVQASEIQGGAIFPGMEELEAAGFSLDDIFLSRKVLGRESAALIDMLKKALAGMR